MKILYIMNVEWNWIKQRPHYIAEGLASTHDVVLYYPYSYHRRGLGFVKNASSNVKPRKYFCIPFRGKSELILKANRIYLRILFKAIVKLSNPDIVWIGKPADIDLIAGVKKPLIYDCMDDYFSLTQGDTQILAQEKAAVEAAQCILASSESLIKKLRSRYQLEKEVFLVRNGYNGKKIDLDSGVCSQDRFAICYVGTVGPWFDFALIERIVREIDSIEVVIVGPIETAVKDRVDECANLPRVTFTGSIEHAKLYDAIKHYDCMIMPFQLNDVVESVDPVKLYEYINYGKNIISIKYNEILRFNKFVQFYTSHDEAIDIIQELMKDRRLRYSLDDRDTFLDENAWTTRVVKINKIINKLTIKEGFGN